jgi:hypothetical protein
MSSFDILATQEGTWSVDEGCNGETTARSCTGGVAEVDEGMSEVGMQDMHDEG